MHKQKTAEKAQTHIESLLNLLFTPANT